MDSLITITLENKEIIRCASLEDARKKAISSEGRVIVEMISKDGGRMETLEFDRKTQDWIPA